MRVAVNERHRWAIHDFVGRLRDVETGIVIIVEDAARCAYGHDGMIVVDSRGMVGHACAIAWADSGWEELPRSERTGRELHPRCGAAGEEP